jgi:tellurite methyltransferase
MHEPIKWYEKESHGSFWEKGYSDKSISTMGGPSLEVFEILPSLSSCAKVLDLGCGEARNALYLAKHGCICSVMDHSKAAIEKIKRVAKDLKVIINAEVADLNNYEIKGNYDLIMAHGCLHFLKNSVWKRLIEKAKESTSYKGFNIFTIHFFNEQFPLLDELKSAGYDVNSIVKGEIREYYSDWELIRDDIYMKWDKHPGLPTHVHPTEKIVVRKSLKDKSPKDYSVKSLYTGNSQIKYDEFLKIEIDSKESDIINKFGKPSLIQQNDFKSHVIGAKKCIETSYVMRDLYYGQYSFQIINGKLRGKYLHESEPKRIRFK